MAWQPILLVLVVGLQATLGVGLYLVLRRLSSPARSSPDLVALLRKDIAESERSLARKLDLILAQVLGQGNLSTGLGDLAKALEQMTAQRERPVVHANSTPREEKPVAVPWPPLSGTEQASGALPRLEVLLNHPDFLSSVWQNMDGAFDIASGHLLRYLSEKGIPEPQIEAFPPLPDGNPNHWIFAVVQGRDHGPEVRRILIPRNFSRYDPALHDHIFEVRGKRPTLDNYIREMQRCALLKPKGELKGFIERELVETPGVLIV